MEHSFLYVNVTHVATLGSGNAVLFDFFVKWYKPMLGIYSLASQAMQIRYAKFAPVTLLFIP